MHTFSAPPTTRSAPAPARVSEASRARIGRWGVGALVAAIAAGSGMAAADVVTTTDGLVLDGRVETDPVGRVTVTTAAGSVRLEKNRVASMVPGDGPETRHASALRALAPDDVDGRFRLALRADAEGAPSVARLAYASVLALDPEHAAARRALGFEREGGAWVTQAEARRARGLVLFDGAWMLPVEADASARTTTAARIEADRDLAGTLRTVAGDDSVLASAARLRWERAAVPVRAATAIALLRDRSPSVRRVACAELGLAADETALRPLVDSALVDPDPTVRREAVLAAASFGNDDTAIPFVKALHSKHLGLVANAARALATMEDRRGLVYLVKRISGHGDSPRVVIETLTKLSYIRDYDVEIAQAANIANPVVGIATEGVVFDVDVLDLAVERTVVETILIDAFNTLAGAHATDVGGVLAWAKANPDAMRGFPARPVTQRGSPKSRAAAR